MVQHPFCPNFSEMVDKEHIQIKYEGGSYRLSAWWNMAYIFFRDMVKAAHLKPLDRTERLAPENLQRGCIWNTFVDKKSDLPTLQNMDVSSSKHNL